MALKRKEDRPHDPLGNQVKKALGTLESMADGGNMKNRPAKEKMKTVTFQMKPSDYEALKDVLADLGLAPGAGIRFALAEFMRKHQGK